MHDCTRCSLHTCALSDGGWGSSGWDFLSYRRVLLRLAPIQQRVPAMMPRKKTTPKIMPAVAPPLKPPPDLCTES